MAGNAFLGKGYTLGCYITVAKIDHQTNAIVTARARRCQE